MQENHNAETEHRSSEHRNIWSVVLVVLLVAAGVFTYAYGHRQSEAVSQLSGENQQLSSTISDMRSQLDALNQKLTTMTTAPQAQAATGSQQSGASHTSGRLSAATNRRLKQMQSELAAQQEELKRTEGDLAEARTDMTGSLNSTRDELSSSIARTHDELVALQKQGERDYFEFDITRGKGFQRTGPISISLRKADVKHKSYDLALLVDDNQLGKKHVNLYEPVWLHREDDPQPLQLVVNKIDRNHIHGYVSAPKNRESALVTTRELQSLAPVSSEPEAPAAQQPSGSNDSQQLPK
ncbi:MAG: hypothetical protein ACRD5M_02930 [Candidatus Acidiferrales bacterium]